HAVRGARHDLKTCPRSSPGRERRKEVRRRCIRAGLPPEEGVSTARAPGTGRARTPEDTMHRTARRSVAIAGASSLVALGALALPAQAATDDGAALARRHRPPADGGR